MEFQHVPVLLQECLEALAVKPDGVYIDGTAGGAGHASHIAQRLTTGRLLALDKDPDAVAASTQRLRPYLGAKVIQSDFSCIPAVLRGEGLTAADGILLDLGVSSFQVDTPERGFSYRYDAPLDMRMTHTGMSAGDLVNTYSVPELVRVLREYGEERFAPQIARNIDRARREQPLSTTGQLVEVIRRSMPAKAQREGGHPAKRTFQAIRIAVNGEMDSLRQCLDEAFACLAPGGRFVIITFHSLEDRMVKQAFAAFSRGCTCPPDFPVCVCGKKPQGRLIYRKAVDPGESEREQNPRSKSAKMRAVEKLEV